MPGAFVPLPAPPPAVLAELAGQEPIRSRLLIAVAHPDDETIGVGAQLHRMEDALLLHVTDGAPRDGEDARRYGFDGLADYATARRRELAAALIAGEAAAIRTAELGIPDKDAFLDLAGLTSRIVGHLQHERPSAILTHAYEGGHPDHDAAAFGVCCACRLAARRERPAIIEMPFYHARDGQMVTGSFLPGKGGETVIHLDDAARRRKQRMVDCFLTQRDILAGLQFDTERFRVAPAYDFRAPPHPGILLYETFGWGISGADWRQRAGEALLALGLD